MPRTATPLRERLERLVIVDYNTDCWLWIGARDANGYGRVAMPTGKGGGRRELAHRAVYEDFVGPIPEGLVLDHLCRFPSCCNPAHLEPVTQRQNLLRGNTLQAANAVKTHCKFNHEFTPENTRIVPRGRRCKACERRRAREQYERKTTTTPAT